MSGRYDIRLPYTAALKRYPTTDAQDAYGNLVAAPEDTIAAVVQFNSFNVAPHDREALVHTYGFVADVVLKKLSLSGTVTDVRNGDILEVSETERYRIFGLTENRGRTGQIHHWSGVIASANTEMEGV